MDIGKIQPVEITEELSRSYLDYAMSVIVARALPDVRDGLKPVHRRILYAMHQMGLLTGGRTKSAKVVGEVLGKYHPHGDMAVYDAMVRLAQDFNMRYPLINGQGNFGCFTKDTKIKLTDGRSLNFGQLIKEQKKGRKHWGYTFNTKENTVEIAEIIQPRLTRKKAELVEVKLDNGQKIRCTPDHRFLLRNGKYKEAKDLKQNDSLMPLYTEFYKGEDKNLQKYERIFQPKKKIWEFAHHLADKWNLNEKIYEKSAGRIRHHKDFNKYNNNPDNIERLSWGEHWKLHYLMTSWKHRNDPYYVKKLAEGRAAYIKNNHIKLSERASERNKKLWRDPNYRERMSKLIRSLWKNSDYRNAVTKGSSSRLKKKWKDKDFQALMSALKSKEMKTRWQDTAFQKKMAIKAQKWSIKLWQDPKHRDHISSTIKKITNNPDWKAMLSKRSKALWKDENYRAKFPQEHFHNIARKLWENEDTRKLRSKKASLQWKDESFRKSMIKSLKKAGKKRLAENPHYMETLSKLSGISLHKKWKNPEYKDRVIKSKILNYSSKLLTTHGKLNKDLYESERHNNGVPTAENALKYFSSFIEIKHQARTYNHKVVSVTPLNHKENVYDLTISPWHNFALDAGIFVHNSVDGDPAAAMRYTEVKLKGISEYILRDVEKDTVDFTDNFDATIKEPTYLPALLPNLLLMGSEGIAVGMATKIPPHNLTEVIEGVNLTIKKGKAVVEAKEHSEKTDFYIKKINLMAAGEDKGFTEEELNPAQLNFESTVTTEELVELVPGPDFPTGGAIYDSKSLVEVYATGRGKIIIRGIAEITEGKKGKAQIIITEIPYQVNKAQLVAHIADLAHQKKIVGISALRDESDKDGMRIVVELKRDARPKNVLNNLYKHTRLQTSFPANFVALVDGTPHTVNLKTVLVEYVKHRQKVITRRTIFELTEAKKRAHILEGLKIALDNLDEVIKTIRASKTQDEAKTNLITKFGLTGIQATAILDMQLRRLAALEREKIEKECEEIKSLIDQLVAILSDPQKVLDIITKELSELKEKYADARHTKIYKQKLGEITEEDLVQKEETIITITKTGYIKRVARNTFRTQSRGGKGVMGMATKEEDEIEQLVAATTHDNLLFFTSKGRVFGTKVWEIPESSRQSKGQALVNFVNLQPDELVLSMLPTNGGAIKNFIMITQKGTVKKTPVDEFKNLRANGLIAIKLEGDDRLISVCPTAGEDHVLLITENGKSIKFAEKDVRPMGRATTGVRGIVLEEDDKVISMEVFGKSEPKTDDKRKKVFRQILTISRRGIGKRTPTAQFPLQKRGGKGVKAAVVTEKTGKLSRAIMVNETVDQIIITSAYGQVIRLPLKNIPLLGRSTQGVILLRFAKTSDDYVASVACLEKEIEADEDKNTGTKKEKLAF